MIKILENLRKETNTTLTIFYSLKKFRLWVAFEGKALEKINENPHFWNIFEVSVRTNLFISLRRLYEGKQGTFNFQHFIEQCIKNTSDFTKEGILSRLNGTTLKNNLGHEFDEENIYEATEDDFRELARTVRVNSKKMKGLYSDAASKIYAHAIHMDFYTIVEVTDQLEFDDMENALLSIWHCYKQVWGMYVYGKKPEYTIGKYQYEQDVYDCLTKQLGL